MLIRFLFYYFVVAAVLSPFLFTVLYANPVNGLFAGCLSWPDSPVRIINVALLLSLVSGDHGHHLNTKT